jgi:hypothetical protein
VPPANGRCNVSFTAAQLPWPPQGNSNPQTTPCGSQRAALNIAPASAPDGTIYTVSKAHFVTRYNYLVAVNSNMTGKWAASMRNRLNDGCGVSFPIGNPGGAGANGGCAAGATLGVDPATNEPPPGRVLDDSSSSPTIAPDGSIFYGAYTLYNFAQGHMMHFSANGDFLNAFNFGWDNTPDRDYRSRSCNHHLVSRADRRKNPHRFCGPTRPDGHYEQSTASALPRFQHHLLTNPSSTYVCTLSHSWAAPSYQS